MAAIVIPDNSDDDDDLSDTDSSRLICCIDSINKKYEISRNAYDDLKTGGELNDEVMNFGIRKEFDSWNNSLKNQSAALSSFFWATLKGIRNLKSDKLQKKLAKIEKSFTKKIDVLKTKWILFAMQQYKHWTLAIINNEDKCLFIVDSIKKTGIYYRDDFNDMTVWLNSISECDAKLTYTRHVPEVPLQKNDTDCGVFVLKNLNFFGKKDGKLTVKFFKQIIIFFNNH